jgi:hypothetical protein
MLVGAVYYHPKVVGSAWMRTNNFTPQDLEGANMLLIFGLSYVLSIALVFELQTMVIHQNGLLSLLAFQEGFDDPGSDVRGLFDDFMLTYGDVHRSFGHGAFHGVIAALLFAAPIVAINGLFERRGWKYILIHVGYWLISLLLMGGILGQFMEVMVPS